MSSNMQLSPWSSNETTVQEGVTARPFGEFDGKVVGRFRLESQSGLVCEVSNFGATLLSLHVPAKDGSLGNIALGYETLDEYVADPFFMGATVGRVANRIAGGRFELGGKQFQLEQNNGAHHLHGGARGWHKQVWSVRFGHIDGAPSAVFARTSPDGESGYPGQLETVVTYQLLDDGLRIVMEARSDSESLVNMAHHSYFNLRGSGSALHHRLKLHCSQFTPGAPDIPDGRIAEVEGTPFDFREEKPLGREFPTSEGAPPGFDHNYLIDGGAGLMRRGLDEPAAGSRLVPVASVFEPDSGRHMRISSNQPALQLYTGNYLDGREASEGRRMDCHSAFCLETQAVPNAISIQKFREQVSISPERPYHHEMLLEFGF
jgi:aldose 1-epimerase